LSWVFASHYAPRMSEYSDKVRAEQLVADGNAALKASDVEGLQRVVSKLYELLPVDRKPSFQFGTGIG
jgi:hypothetical protein